MVGSDRRSPDDLKLTLIKEGRAFSFYQVMRLLRLFDKNTRTGDATYLTSANIRIFPNLSLTFPASDVEKIQAIEGDNATRYHVTANFLGLYGSSSPLPTFYTEDLIDEASDDESAGREFINILNHRLYLLLFETWEKYRQFIQVTEEKNPQYIERLFCLIGLGETIHRKEIPDALRLLRYMGLFSQFPRSAAGLKTILEDALGLPVEVVPCVMRKARIPDDQLLRLGKFGAVLGKSSFVGREIPDRTGKFRLRVGPLSAVDYRRFFPGSDTYNELVMLTNLYLLDPLEYELEVYMQKKQTQTARLGGAEWSRLGMDTWLFAGKEIGETKSTFYPTRYSSVNQNVTINNGITS